MAAQDHSPFYFLLFMVVVAIHQSVTTPSTPQIHPGTALILRCSVSKWPCFTIPNSGSISWSQVRFGSLQTDLRSAFRSMK